MDEVKELPSGAVISEKPPWRALREASRQATVTMPAGEYWVGDPCYAVGDPHERWIKWLEDSYGDRDGNHVATLLADMDGMPVLGINTAHGDGVYLDGQGRTYGVDAGLIGLVDARLWTEDEAPFGMYLESFDGPVRCRYLEEGGTIQLGPICIKTDPEDDYYSEDYYEEDES